MFALKLALKNGSLGVGARIQADELGGGPVLGRGEAATLGFEIAGKKMLLLVRTVVLLILSRF